MRIAVVGAGISGLACAHWLHPHHEVTVFEAEDRLGGHTHTIAVELADGVHQVDTGFIVFNDLNYPRFSGLLDQLGVATQASEMSFSVSAASPDMEYRGNGLRLWAQPTNALRPSFARLLADVLRFNRDARRLLASGAEGGTVADLLAAGAYGPRLAEHYLTPLMAAIWSADPTTVTAMPAATVARFLDNHGMLRLKGRPQWRTVVGGSARYVEALVAPFAGRIRRAEPIEKVVREDDVGAGGAPAVTLVTARGPETFDAVVLAVHSDQAVGLLSDPDGAERAILGAIGYQPNTATLHTDRAMLPRRRRAWASWNAHLPADPADRPTVTYWMNCLQRLDTAEPICVTLNRDAEIDPARVLGQWTYAHPVLDGPAVAAQRRLPEIQGRRATFYCGAYWGYGFHEDGVESAAGVCRAIGVPCP